jgi:hypothetical protein
VAQYNGNVYLLNGQNNSVYEYANNGKYLGAVVSSASATPFDATDITFGLDGNLYITLGQTGEIIRYSSNGTFLGVFALGPGGATDMNGMAFRSDGLYVSDYLTQQIVLYGLDGGGPTIVNPASGQVDSLVFGPAGDLFGTNDSTGQVDDFTTASTFAWSFGGAPRGLQFGSDGFLYVASQQGNAIDRVNGTTGGAATVFASGEGLTNALDFALVENSDPDAPEPSTAILALTGLIAGSAVFALNRTNSRRRTQNDPPVSSGPRNTYNNPVQ